MCGRWCTCCCALLWTSAPFLRDRSSTRDLSNSYEACCAVLQWQSNATIAGYAGRSGDLGEAFNLTRSEAAWTVQHCTSSRREPFDLKLAVTAQMVEPVMGQTVNHGKRGEALNLPRCATWGGAAEKIQLLLVRKAAPPILQADIPASPLLLHHCPPTTNPPRRSRRAGHPQGAPLSVARHPTGRPVWVLMLQSLRNTERFLGGASCSGLFFFCHSDMPRP